MYGRRVVITGMGAATPIGIGIPEFERGLKEGRDGSVLLDQKRLTEFELYEGLRTDRIAPVCTTEELNGLVADLGLEKKIINKMSRAQKLGYIAGKEARKDAGLDSSIGRVSSLSTKRGIAVASGMGGFPELAKEIHTRKLQSEKKKMAVRHAPHMMPMSLITAQAEQLIWEFNIEGSGSAHAEACAASLMALDAAYGKIYTGRKDLMLVLGTEATISPNGTGGFDSIKGLTHSGQSSSPFDPNRNGFLEGEAAGAVILESYESAKRRGATIYAELKGVGTSLDTYHVVSPNPTGRTGAIAMNDVISWSGVKKNDIDEIQMHGTSTPLGDIAEVRAVKSVFGEEVPYITAPKSQLGHSKGSSAMLSSIAAILTINNSFINPIINTQEIDPEILALVNLDRFVLGKTYTDVEINNVLVNAFAFGRTGASALFSKV